MGIPKIAARARTAMPTLLFFYGLTTVIKQTERRQKRGCGGGGGIFQRVESVCMGEQPCIGRLSPAGMPFPPPLQNATAFSPPRAARGKDDRDRGVRLFIAEQQSQQQPLTHRCAPRVQGDGLTFEIFPVFCHDFTLDREDEVNRLQCTPRSTL